MNGSPAKKGRRGKAVMEVKENHVDSVNGIRNAMQKRLQLQNLLKRGPNQASMMMAGFFYFSRYADSSSAGDRDGSTFDTYTNAQLRSHGRLMQHGNVVQANLILRQR
jgi:hypothetical protein